MNTLPGDIEMPEFQEPEGKRTGDLEGVIEHWDGSQSYEDTCAIRCQEFVIERFTGDEINEHLLVQEAYEQGWYSPGEGTSLGDVGKLLELHDIEINRYINSNIFHLADELTKGHNVIVGVDSGELWDKIPIYDDLGDELGFEASNHAVVVSGIDTREPGNPQVIISDPGTGEPHATYPLEQFVLAWEDSSFFMISTAEAPPIEHVPELANLGEIMHSPMLSLAGGSLPAFLFKLWNSLGVDGDFPYHSELGAADPSNSPPVQDLLESVDEPLLSFGDDDSEFDDDDDIA